MEFREQDALNPYTAGMFTTRIEFMGWRFRHLEMDVESASRAPARDYPTVMESNSSIVDDHSPTDISSCISHAQQFRIMSRSRFGTEYLYGY